MKSNLLLILLVVFISIFAIESIEDAELPSVGSTFGVAITTIPSRFKDIHHTIRSWLLQKGGPPLKIVVFVPKSYQRFKTGKGAYRSFLEVCKQMVEEKFADEIAQRRIVFIQTKRDYGPLTKFAGLLENWKQLKRETRGILHWIIGDDDVYYDDMVMQKYYNYNMQYPDGINSRVLTHFSETTRIFIRLDEEQARRAVTHVQGVDTFSLSTALLSHQMAERKQLFWPKLRRMVRFFHTSCPASFYQDDYLISFVFNVANFTVRSLWDDTRVAGHIDGVSKHNHQMHMMDQVMTRESETQKCVMMNAKVAAKMLTSEDDEQKHTSSSESDVAIGEL